jgi:hypothetical protein
MVFPFDLSSTTGVILVSSEQKKDYGFFLDKYFPWDSPHKTHVFYTQKIMFFFGKISEFLHEFTLIFKYALIRGAGVNVFLWFLDKFYLVDVVRISG